MRVLKRDVYACLINFWRQGSLIGCEGSSIVIVERLLALPLVTSSEMLKVDKGLVAARSRTSSGHQHIEWRELRAAIGISAQHLAAFGIT
eukprot:2851209-Pleurochrysis_carterae.AAC.3